MKVSTMTVPVVLVGMIFVFVWAMGILVVKSSAVATEGSLELLRLHIEVARMHDALLVHSQQSMTRDLGELPRGESEGTDSVGSDLPMAAPSLGDATDGTNALATPEVPSSDRGL